MPILVVDHLKKVKNKMAKLLLERFQKLAGIKTAGLALQNEMYEEESNDIVSKLKDILKTWETKKYASDEARYKEYYKDIENLVNKQ